MYILINIILKKSKTWEEMKNIFIQIVYFKLFIFM
jgi:hypothetical protein